jgi:hypothetical protein
MYLKDVWVYVVSKSSNGTIIFITNVLLHCNIFVLGKTLYATYVQSLFLELTNLKLAMFVFKTISIHSKRYDFTHLLHK